MTRSELVAVSAGAVYSPIFWNTSIESVRCFQIFQDTFFTWQEVLLQTKKSNYFFYSIQFTALYK